MLILNLAFFFNDSPLCSHSICSVEVLRLLFSALPWVRIFCCCYDYCVLFKLMNSKSFDVCNSYCPMRYEVFFFFVNMKSINNWNGALFKAAKPAWEKSLSFLAVVSSFYIIFASARWPNAYFNLLTSETRLWTEMVWNLKHVLSRATG